MADSVSQSIAVGHGEGEIERYPVPVSRESEVSFTLETTQSISSSRPASIAQLHLPTERFFQESGDRDRGAVVTASERQIIEEVQISPPGQAVIQAQVEAAASRHVRIDEATFIPRDSLNGSNIINSHNNSEGNIDERAVNNNNGDNVAIESINDESNSNHSSNRELRRMGGQREQVWPISGEYAGSVDMGRLANAFMVIDLQPQIQMCGFILGSVIGPLAFYIESAFPNISSDFFRKHWFRRGVSIGLAVHFAIVIICLGSMAWSLMN